jgi:sarcosine oxidase subunit beta
MNSADVVIVGGGVIGTACADALAREGLQVILLERLGLAAGASSACQSGIGYGPFGSDYDLKFDLAAIAEYRQLAASGVHVDYHCDGALLVGEPTEEPRIRARLEQLRRMGVACDWLDAAALRQAEPNLSPALTGAALLHDVGQVSPMRVVVELTQRAARHGAHIETNTELIGVEIAAGRVAAAVTTRGRIATRRLVVAAGAWSRAVGCLAGLRKVPVWPLKGHVLVIEPAPGLLRRYSTETGYEAGVAAIRQSAMGEAGPEPGPPQVAAVLQPLPSGQMLVGSSREFAGFDREVSRERLAQIAGRACRLVPSLARHRVIRTYAGLRPWSPDGHPLIGPTQQSEGVFFATGHAGEGNTRALITARLVADLMMDRTPPLDTTPLAPDRFVMN